MSAVFTFKHFHVDHSRCAMKVGTDAIMLGAWVNINDVSNVVDVGAGTGILSLIVAQRNTGAKLTALEIEPACAVQAAENFKNSPWHDRTQCFEVDARTWQCEQKFDLLISNPPYFANSLKAENKVRSIARHTDSLGLEDIIDLWNRVGATESTFALVLPYSYLNQIEELCSQHGFSIWRRLDVKAKASTEPNRLLVQLSREQKTTERDELVVHGDKGYTDRYKQLTKDLYIGH